MTLDRWVTRAAALAAGIVLAGVVALAGAGPSLAAAPGNDNFANASTLQIGSFLLATNVDGTKEAGEPATYAGQTSSNSVWWKYTATQTSMVTLSTVSSDIDTVVAVFTGTAVTALGAPVVENDDVSFPSVTASKVSFLATSGVTYYIVIDGIFETGDIILDLYLSSAPEVQVSVSTSGGGTANGAGPYRTGRYAYLHAHPSAGQELADWREGTTVLGYDRLLALGVVAAHAVVANFVSTSAVFTIATASSPAAGGSTSGGSASINGGQMTIVHATPAPNFVFWNWTEGSVVVSTTPDFTFRVGGSRTLIANFRPYSAITLAADPPSAGTVIGGGVLPPGSPTTISAIARNHWGLEGWFENGALVSEANPWTFTVDGPRNLVGHFIGPEFQVNTYTKGHQEYPDVVRLAGGAFVVVWHSEGEDGSGQGIYGQRYSAKGKPLGREFRVNTTKKNDQIYPRIAALSGGGFVVVWTSGKYPQYDVVGQRFTANGAFDGKEFRVNAPARSDRESAGVAGLPDGGFVAVWAEYNKKASKSGILGQRYDAGGASVGGAFRVNSSKPFYFGVPDIAVLGNGSFVVTWDMAMSKNGHFGVYGQRYDAGGARQGKEFPVSFARQWDNYYAAVAATQDGGFVVAWEGVPPDRHAVIINAQRFAANGKLAGGPFRVSDPDAFSDYQPTVEGLPNGGFVVAWWGRHAPYADAFARRYNAKAKPGRQVRVNPYSIKGQGYPALASRPDSTTFAAWTSYDEAAPGGDIYGILNGP